MTKFSTYYCEADRVDYDGEVLFIQIKETNDDYDCYIYGFLDAEGIFTELFCDGPPGRSHLRCGTKHQKVKAEDMYLVTLAIQH